MVVMKRKNDYSERKNSPSAYIATLLLIYGKIERLWTQPSVQKTGQSSVNSWFWCQLLIVAHRASFLSTVTLIKPF